jgi:hypothetical protein
MAIGFYIQKLSVTGNGKPPAEITLKPGFNVVAGASNTGKTFIFQCIDFMMGGKKPPKSIPESAAYTNVIIEIKNYNGKVYQLRRELSGGYFYLKNITVNENIGEEVLLEKLSTDPRNISTFLLTLCGLENVVLKKNKINQKVRLSFRDIAGLSLVDEKTIITEDSPVYWSGESVTKTREQSLFYYLLTGQDATGFTETEDPKTLKNKIIGKIELTKELIKKTQDELNQFKGENIEQLQKDLDDEYEKLNLEYRKTIAAIDNTRNERTKYYKNIEKLDTKVLFKNELLQRFNLLQKHYQSDLKRLDFISEGSYLLNQLNDVECPICGSVLDSNHFEHLNQFHSENENLLQSINNEAQKIKLKVKELTETLRTLEDGIIKQKKTISNLKIKVIKIDDELNNSLTPVSKTLKERLQILFKKKSGIERYERLRNEMQSYYLQLNDLTNKLNQKISANDQALEQHGQSFIDFSSIVEKILNDWKYPDITNVTFNRSFNEFDIRINNVPRASNGKGYRAITYSAFLYGLMSYCKLKQHNHPFFLLLDSPLTTFKENDPDLSSSDKIDDKIEHSYFESLSKISTDTQIIVLENKEPDEDIKLKINYMHFSGKKGIGRQGFFPS